MKQRKHLTRAAAVLAAGALLSMGAIGIAQSANAATGKDQTAGAGQTPPDRPGGNRGPGGPGGPERGNRAAPVHRELVVKLADGSFQTRVGITGTVTSVSATSIAVKAADSYTATFAVASTTKVMVNGKTAAATDVKVGDTVHVEGVRSGTTLTAEAIRSGTPAAAKTTGS